MGRLYILILDCSMGRYLAMMERLEMNAGDSLVV